ncbi:hypothetical protein ACOBR2_13275 [Telmatobacter bradus]|uniref:hypothetical protein n=1 Tax=Telmatobacter bradus TaxID=474953 RepID=UPI003B438870
MPQLTDFSWFLWGTVAVAQAVACATVYKRRHEPIWGSLFMFLAWNCALTSLLILIALFPSSPDHRAYLYFYTFWPGESISSVVMISVITGIAQEQFGYTPLIKKCIFIGTPAACIGFAAAAYPNLSFNYSVPAISQSVILSSRAICLGWIGVSLIYAIASEILGLRFRTHCHWIALGLSISLTSELIHSFLIKALPIVSLDVFKSATYLVSLAIWTRAALTPQSTIASPSLGDLRRIKSSTEIFLKAFTGK